MVDIKARRQGDRATLGLNRKGFRQFHAGQEDVKDVAATGAGRASGKFGLAILVGITGQRHLIERTEQVANFWIFHTLLQNVPNGVASDARVEQQIGAGRNTVKGILKRQRNHQFVDQRHPQAGDLDIGRRVANGVQGANDTGGGATGARPDAQHRFTTLFDTGHRHFDHQAVNIKRRNRIDRLVVIGGIANRRRLTAQGQEIKDLQVNPEGVIGLAGIDLHGSLRRIEGVDRRIGQALVVGG